MQPLKIVAALDRAVASLEMLQSLDGVLAAARVMEEEERGSGDPWSLQHDLPLQRYVSPSGEWVFMASLFEWRPIQPALMQFYTSRHDPVRMSYDIDDGVLKYRRARLQTEGGRFRSVYEHYSLQWCSEAVAYAIGDAQRIRELLDRIRWLGSKRSLCCGRVRAWSVETDESAHENWMRRALPVDFDLRSPYTYAQAHQTLQPPYWRKTDRRAVLAPI